MLERERGGGLDSERVSRKRKQRFKRESERQSNNIWKGKIEVDFKGN